MRIAVFIAACSLMLAASRATVADAETPREIRFNQHIRPLLTENCLACHGPDSAIRKADLRLDTPRGALGSGIIVPGDASASELIARITSDDPDVVMPPPDSGNRLSDEDKQLLTRWINAGAHYEKHWAFIKPRKASLPGRKALIVGRKTQSITL